MLILKKFFLKFRKPLYWGERRPIPITTPPKNWGVGVLPLLNYKRIKKQNK